MVPNWIKRVLRFVKYSDERKRFFRERKIIKSQNAFIQKYNRNTENLIIFFVPGADRKSGLDTISGGVTSIISLSEESSKLSSIHNAEVITCVFPREYLLLKHLNFENSVTVFRFEQLPDYFTNLKHIIIHIPEFLVVHFIERLFKSEFEWLKNIPFVHFNIINANILLMPATDKIKILETLSDKITITTAHTKYCTEYYRSLYGYPLHKFSAWISPEQYTFVNYEDKKDIIVISPDVHPEKEKTLKILDTIKSEQKILQNLPYNEFKKIIGEAKWALTFGEGLDGYILEPIFSGCIAFAVYNEDFFTDDFKNTPGIFNSYEELQDDIISMIKRLDSPKNYIAFQKLQFDKCAEHYNYDAYQNNIKLFYKGEYTFA